MTTYGNKRDYAKIDIIVDGVYKCSTTWAKSPKQAIEKWREANPSFVGQVRAHYAQR